MGVVSNVVVVGGGSAGFLAAIALKRRMPDLAVCIVRSPDIGIIGVGEGSTDSLTKFIHGYLGIGFKEFFEVAEPTWKLGLKFIWGPRPVFNYTFNNRQINEAVGGLRKSKGYYLQDDLDCEDPLSALMAHDRAFERLPNGNPAVHMLLAYHVENDKFVAFLERHAQRLGVDIRDDTVVGVEQNDEGIASVHLRSGGQRRADLWVDCSGFVSALLGKELNEPFIDFKSSLACDRAVVGGWRRTDELIKPYTTCENTPSGWCWQIEHEHRINRGLVYSSSFTTDDQAETEFRTANPKVEATRIVKFRSGRYERAWVKNVVAIGNAYGFVEPLEATALGVIAVESSLLADSLREVDRQPRQTQRTLFNRHVGGFWDNIRAFLAVHYKFNTRFDTPFWVHCRQETDLAKAQEIVELYREQGPTPLWAQDLIDPTNQFGLAGYYAQLVGQQVSYHATFTPTAEERQIVAAHCQQFRQRAQNGLTVRQSLDIVRSPQWTWPKLTR